MGNQKQKWTSEEEGALKAGVSKYGTGKWKNILKDPEFAPFLANRSNIDLKDKWRNLSISTGLIPKDKFKAPRLKPITTGALPIVPDSSAPVSVAIVKDDEVDNPSRGPHKENNGPSPRYNSMIIEAITTMKDPNGSDIGDIVRYIEQRHHVPHNFRRLLSSKLRKLVLQGKLEKVQNCFKIKDAALGAKTPILKQKDVKQGPSQNSGSVASSETMVNFAIAAACTISDAEYRSCVTADAVNVLERVVKMSEDADSALHLVKDIYDLCKLLYFCGYVAAGSNIDGSGIWEMIPHRRLTS